MNDAKYHLLEQISHSKQKFIPYFTSRVYCAINLNLFMPYKKLLLALFILVSISAEAQYFAKGRVHLDRNSDGQLDRFDFPQASVRVHILRDIDGDGVIDAGDTLVATGVTNGDGEYEIMIPQGKIIQVRVSNSNDDAEEDTDDGDMSRTSTNLEMIEDGAQEQLVGIRFRNVPIANSATINHAFITFTVDQSDNGATNLTIEGEAADNSGAFSNADFNISSRARSTNDVNWSNIPAWTASRQQFNTPDLSSIVDEVIGRAGYTGGNAITFIITGSGERTAESFDGSAANAPLLTLDYGSGTSTYIARVYTTDLSTGATLTSAANLALNFGAPGDTIDSLNFGYTGEPVACFAIADVGDVLYQLNRFSFFDSIVAGVSVANVEGMTFDRSRVDILGANSNRLGLIDKITGGFEQRPNAYGTGGGAAGNISFSDVDAIAMDVALDTLFGVFQTRLFVINSVSGAHSLIISERISTTLPSPELEGIWMISRLTLATE